MTFGESMVHELFNTSAANRAVRRQDANKAVRIGTRWVGEQRPVYLIAEIGINHNGSLELAEKLIEGAASAGCDAVKFQKRTPALCVPEDQWDNMRETPWGPMRYIDYKEKIEFGADEYAHIERVCQRCGVDWFASAWDIPSVEFLEQFEPPCYKVASASLTDHELLRFLRKTNRPLIISTGMSTLQEIEAGVDAVGRDELLIAHSTSTYPCPTNELNLRMIQTLKQLFPECPIGYSGHEPDMAPTWAAVALGATFVERHITLDRNMWGTDHGASVELSGLSKLVEYVRHVELSLGDGIKRVYPSEVPIREKLRRVMGGAAASNGSALDDGKRGASRG